MDLFACRLNRQLENHISWFPDPFAFTSDAFSVSCSDFKPFIFLPFCLIGRVLQKLEDDQVSKDNIVVPKWATQPWYQVLLNMLIGILAFTSNSKSTSVNSQQSVTSCEQKENVSIRSYGIRRNRRNRGLSDKSIELISNQWRQLCLDKVEFLV